MTNLQDLQDQAFHLHGLIVSEPHIPTKRKLMDQRAKVIEKIQTLELKRDKEREAQAIDQIDQLLKTSERTFVLTINGIRIKPDEDLTFPVTFLPCNHEHKIHIKELLSYQKVPMTNQVLLAKWQGILKTPTILTTRFNCLVCREKKDKKFKMFRRYSEKDIIGTCQVTLQII